MTRARLLMLAVVVGVLAVLVWRERNGSRERILPNEPLVFPELAAAPIRSLSVYQRGVGYRLVTNGENWVLADLPEEPLNQQLVANMLRSLSVLRGERFSPAEDDSAYGLRTPVLELDLAVAEENRRLSFGDKHPLSERRYAKLDRAADRLLVDEVLFSILNKSRFEVRDQTPFRFVSAAVREVTVSGSAGFKLLRQGESWLVEAGTEKFRGDDERIVAFLEELSRIRIKRFIDSPAKDRSLYGLATPSQKIVSIDSENASLVAALGEVRLEEANAAKPAYYAQLEGRQAVFELEGRVGFPADAAYFRTRSPLAAVAVDGITSVCVRTPESEFEVRYEESSWHFFLACSSQQSAAEATDDSTDRFIREWLRKVTLFRVLSYVESGPITAPVLDIALATRQGERWQLRVDGAVEGDTSADAPRFGSVTTPDNSTVSFVLSSAELEAIMSIRKFTKQQGA